MSRSKTNFAYLGIDPGVSGGAVIRHGKTVHVHKFKNELEARTWLDDFTVNNDNIHRAIIESQHQGQGEKNAGALLENFGFWKGLLYGMEIPFRCIPPATWQKPWRAKLRDKNGDPFRSYEDHKRALKTIARSLDDQKYTLATCDARIMAEFLYKLHTEETYKPN